MFRSSANNYNMNTNTLFVFSEAEDYTSTEHNFFAAAMQRNKH